MFIVSIYFFVLTQKSNKKNQGKSRQRRDSARFPPRWRDSADFFGYVVVIDDYLCFIARHHLVV